MIFSILLATSLTAAPAVPAAPSQTLTTLTLAIGLGGVLVALVVGIVAPVINAGVARRQREHDLQVRQQQYDHELRLERLRDLQRLRDARLERLRAALSSVSTAAWEINAPAEQREKVVFREGTAALLLEAGGEGFVNVLGAFAGAVYDAEGHDNQEARDAVGQALMELQHAGRRLLVEIEQRPLEAN